MAGRFPGAPDLDTFWRNLRDGVDSITEVPPDRFSLQGIYDPQPGKPGRSYCKHGGFLEGVDRFDPRFFGITSAEAEVMDPQQRLFLETAWHALEDAGLPDRALDGAACAVFVGCSHGDYAQMAGTARLSAQFGMGNVGSILAARIAYHLNLRGPAVAVDTACSSSLVAVHLACQALRTGECDLAVAGGVALMTTPGMHVLTSHARMLSPGGRCRTFDAAADGFVPAEGVGAVVLKPLARAMADGDRIHGVIEGTGTNQDGRSAGLTRPSLAAQRELQLAVWARFRVDPATIGCIEAHGTGTALGDPIEMQALIDAFRSRAPAMRQGRCAIGSVKSNIGHAVPAAGIAGLIKALLMLRHATVAPSLHFHEPNPHVDLANSPFHVPKVAAPWPAPPGDGPRRVAINAFGFSGTNAHAVVADAPAPPPAPAREAPWLFALSARTPDALRRRAADLSAWLGRTPDAPLADVAHTLAAGRGHMRHRAAVIAADRGELVAALDALAQDGSPSSSASPQGGKAATHSALAGLARAEEAEGRGTALADLAEAYRAGAGLGPLENRASGRFLSLPGYPFERRRCWVEAGPTVASPPPRAPDEHHVPADLALLVQHVVRGRPVLPAAAGLAMLLGACGPHRALVELRWLRPALPDADGLRLHLLRDEPSPDGTGVALAVAGGGRHMAARLVEDGHLVPGASMDLAAILARCSDPVPVELLYARLAALDIAHGPAFRCVAGLRRSPTRDELLADLVPGGEADAVPFLIDAALHSIAALSDAAPDGEPPLPASLERAVAHGPVADARHAWVRLRAADPAVDGSSDGCFDLVISDEAGRVLLRLDGFRSRPSGTTRASQRASTAVGDDEGRLAFFRPVWRVVPATADAAASAALPTLVLWGAGSEALARAVAGPAGRVAPLLSADMAAEIAHGLPPGGRIVVLGGSATDNGEIHAVLRLLQTLVAADRPAELTVVSVEASDAALGAPRNWRGAALLGLAKVAMREASRLSVAALDIGACGLRSPEATARAILAEPAQRLPRPDAVPDDVALRGGLRLTRALEEVALGPVPSGGDGCVRRRGVYLLMGGAGGIGAALARRLAAAHSARLVLVGRAAPGARHAALCAELVALGGEAVYEAADCADSSAMAGLRDRTLARFGVVHGVFHAAFILADRTLSGMSGSELGAALRPKLDGTQAVIEAFSGLPLDFLALFSSTNAFTANAGQANYVAASMAQDAAGAWFFAQGIPIRTVNWGFWGEVGRVSTGFHRERLRRSGGGMIGTEEGLDALLSVLGAGVPSVSVLKLKAPQRAVPQNRSGASLPDVLLEVVPNLRIAASGMAGLFTELADGMQALEAWGRRVLRDTLPRSLAHATETEDGAPWRSRMVAALSALANAADAAPQGAPPATDGPLAPYTRLLAACLDGLPDVVAGRRSANAVLFPGGSTELVDGVYRGTSMAEALNRLTAEAVAGLAAAIARRRSQGGAVSILEVGAGTGATSLSVLRLLRSRGIAARYRFTDISPHLVGAARARLASEFPHAEFEVLDLAAPPGAAREGADILLAANVLHALPDISAALAGAKARLAPGGLLVALEAVSTQDLLTMTFGLTREWWAFDDSPRRLPGGGPLLDPPRWRAALAEAGFQRAQILGPITGEDGPAGHALLLAQSDGFVAPASAVPPHVAAPESGDRATPPPRPAPPPAPGAADDAVRGIVRGVLAEALDLDPSGLEDDAELVALGLDFIGMVDVQERLERVVGPLPQAVLTGMSSVATLADAVAAAMAPERRGASGEAAGPVPAAAAPPPAPRPPCSAEQAGTGPRASGSRASSAKQDGCGGSRSCSAPTRRPTSSSPGTSAAMNGRSPRSRRRWRMRCWRAPDPPARSSSAATRTAACWRSRSRRSSRRAASTRRRSSSSTASLRAPTCCGPRSTSRRRPRSPPRSPASSQEAGVRATASRRRRTTCLSRSGSSAWQPRSCRPAQGRLRRSRSSGSSAPTSVRSGPSAASCVTMRPIRPGGAWP